MTRPRPSERHISFAMYEQWSTPMVAIAIGGHVLTSEGAAVYDRIFGGSGSHHDFVTMYDTGPFGDTREPAFFEFYFADDDASTLSGAQLPTADQLANFPVKQLSFGTDTPGMCSAWGSWWFVAWARVGDYLGETFGRIRAASWIISGPRAPGWAPWSRG